MGYARRQKKFPVLLSDIMRKGSHICPAKCKNLDVVDTRGINSFSKMLSFDKRNLGNQKYQAGKCVEKLSLTSELVRNKMVERISSVKSIHPSVLDAMRVVPRHQFVDPALAAKAYEEIALPIGASQTISRPTIVACMLSHLIGARNLPLMQVLEVGTGCGYQTALLSFLAKNVYSIERIKYLHERAKQNLRFMSRPNIRLLYGDGSVGVSKASPFDGIILSAAGSTVSPLLRNQVAIGGRIIAPVGVGSMQRLLVMERVTVSYWRENFLDEVKFVPLRTGVS